MVHVLALGKAPFSIQRVRKEPGHQKYEIFPSQSHRNHVFRAVVLWLAISNNLCISQLRGLELMALACFVSLMYTLF